MPCDSVVTGKVKSDILKLIAALEAAKVKATMKQLGFQVTYYPNRSEYLIKKDSRKATFYTESGRIVSSIGNRTKNKAYVNEIQAAFGTIFQQYVASWIAGNNKNVDGKLVISKEIGGIDLRIIVDTNGEVSFFTRNGDFVTGSQLLKHLVVLLDAKGVKFDGELVPERHRHDDPVHNHVHRPTKQKRTL